MDFVSPMHLGELAEIKGQILYTSSHSLEVQVSVMSEDIIKGKESTIVINGIVQSSHLQWHSNPSQV